MIKTLIFDLGNVIVRFDHSRIVQRIEQFCELKSDEVYSKIFASTFVHDYDHGRISSLEFYDKAKELLDLQMSFNDFSVAWNCTFDLEPILPEELIKSLSEKYRLLILSDTNELHFEFIRENFRALNYFDDYVLSYQIGAIKPAPEIFRATIERANCLPEECFFTDDREPNVLGAEKVGINAIQFISAERFMKDLEKLNLL